MAVAAETGSQVQYSARYVRRQVPVFTRYIITLQLSCGNERKVQGRYLCGLVGVALNRLPPNSRVFLATTFSEF